MKQYPKPIPLPKFVKKARKIRRKQVLFSAWIGVFIRMCIILFELFGVYLFGSEALFLDAVASSIDVVSTIILIVCIILASRPPDEDHPFGHGRYEPLIGLLIGVGISVIGVVLFVKQGFEVTESTVKEPLDFRAWMFPFVALVLLEICYRIVITAAKKHDSPALAADAVHYRIDGVTSLMATVALILAAYFPQWSSLFDHIGALAIAVLMMGLEFFAARSNFHQLMDKTPDEEFFTKVRQAALKVQGVKGTEKINIQFFGPDAHVDIDIEVDPNLTVLLAHKISQKVRAEIQKTWPAVRDVMVHIEPYYPNDH